MHRLLSLTCLLLCCWLVSTDLTLEILDSDFANQTGARCLDGSPGSFHVELGAENKKWVIYMEGGGSCATEEECIARTQTALGSSANQPELIEGSTVFSSDPVANPGFWNWTHVRMDYCSGDRWAGTRVNASTETWGLYFAGHVIFKSLIEHLIATYDLDQATEILFQGGSAGALGVMTNVDYLNRRLPAPRISLGMNAGWGVDFTPAWSGSGTQGVIDVVFNLYQAHVNEDCAAVNPANVSMCIFPRYVFEYIPNRLFILNSLIDTVQLAILGFQNAEIFSTAGTNYVTALGYYTKLSILDNFKRNPRVDGLFVTTCPDHGIGFQINGVMPNVAEANWYYRPKTSTTPAINYDNCLIESVVSLLKTNTSLFTDCATMMRLCTKNSVPNAFEAEFISAPLPSDEPVATESPIADGPTVQAPTSVVKEPTDVTSTATASYLGIVAFIVLALNTVV